MKKGIHPELFFIKARCVCGTTYDTSSTKEDILVSRCSACHPFYTNKKQFADAEGRIEKFNRKYGLK